MSDIVLSVENIWKQYRLGTVGTGTIREDVSRWWAKMRGKEDPTMRIGEANDRDSIKGDYVWALQDINFEVKRGEVLGIIGKNGAGKSTLLKILSKVTTPTKGSIKTKGRIASLLEVGTGFHPELTGRENIFLNGAILGMDKDYIKSRFEQIVEFSGIGKYIDTPVKRYSSGMYVRLAFAVAAHLEPEILIIDEVLAVGDAEFQKKCLGKMKDVSGEGRTVLFVSHDMRAVKSLCNEAIMLTNGQMSLQGTSEYVVNNYLRAGIVQNSNIKFPILKDDIIIHDFRISQNGLILEEFSGDYSIHLCVDFELYHNLTSFRIGFFIKDQQGQLISRKLLADWDGNYENLKEGRYLLKTYIPSSFLTTGSYTIEVHSSRYGIKDYQTCVETSTVLQITAPTRFNPAHMGEITFGSIIWNTENEIINVI